jgi:hypothetical protein
VSCTVCGADLRDGAMFCGECGSAVVERTAGDRADTGSPAAERPVVPPPGPQEPDGSDPVPQAQEPDTEDSLLEAPRAEPVPADGPAPAPTASAPDEQTRLPQLRLKAPAARFVLQFSTGESVTVEGTGLIGRRPQAQPGEYFDVLVSVDDPGRSVSKTHLEFGQEGGTFWVNDRFSANGTVVREPDRAARLSVPGMRSRVQRGSRVEIGEQFFVVS